MSDKTKCCCCGKEIDMTQHVIPPTWYAKFQGDHVLIAVICNICIADKDNHEKWIK